MENIIKIIASPFFIPVEIYFLVGFIMTGVAILEITEINSPSQDYYNTPLYKLILMLAFMFFCGPGYILYMLIKEGVLKLWKKIFKKRRY